MVRGECFPISHSSCHSGNWKASYLIRINSLEALSLTFSLTHPVVWVNSFTTRCPGFIKSLSISIGIWWDAMDTPLKLYPKHVSVLSAMHFQKTNKLTFQNRERMRPIAIRFCLFIKAPSLTSLGGESLWCSFSSQRVVSLSTSLPLRRRRRGREKNSCASTSQWGMFKYNVPGTWLLHHLPAFPKEGKSRTW